VSVIPVQWLHNQLARSLLFLFLLSGSAQAEEALEWPQEVTAPEGTIVVYQPQPESLEGNVLTGRAAIALEFKDREEPVFGAMWFSARIDTDREQGIALVRDLKVTKVGWPDSKDASEQRFTQLVESAIPESGFEISLERLSASLATAEVERKSLEDLKSEPPDIRFSETVAVLLLYDGEPFFSKVEGSSYERVLNTPFLVVKETKSGRHYLGNGAFWYEAKDALGPWTPTDKPPADLVQMVESGDGAEQEAPAGGEPPVVVVATTPTELIATDGKPKWTSLTGGKLLYVENTETPWVRELSTNNMYVLLSGRWYRSSSQKGPWTFVPADELPASFSEIPPASDIGGLRTSVAGTEEAEEALLDAAIPQTAAINRSEATLQVEYDGSPEFEKVPGTEVSYAVNTGSQVLLVNKRYYAVDDGVWFTSAAATGPWVVADTIPQEEIAKIPPSSPVYNTTHVHIYESTPQVVYVGYTPGYLWSFPYYGVPVYGTGWYYPPYYGRYYYPRQPTWGFNVGYNPWTGWNFGLSYSNGFFNFGMSWGGGWGGSYRPWGCCGGGWYGGGYRGPTIINTGDINIGNNVNIGNRATINNRVGDNNLRLGDNNRSRNIYNRPENRARVADRSMAQQSLKKARPASNRANDVYVDRNGNVARRTDQGWETRGDGGWQRDDLAAAASRATPEQRDRAAQAAGNVTPEQRDQARQKAAQATPQQREQAAQQARDRAAKQSRPATTPSVSPPASRPATRPATRPQVDRSGLNRAHQARSTGVSRERARPAASRGNVQRRR